MRNALYLFAIFTAILFAQKTDERIARIEENTSVKKESTKKTDGRIEGVRKDLRALQDRVVAVDSQNKIIISIAAAAFSIGLGFLIWLSKKLDASLQQQSSFRDQDSEVLVKIYQKLTERSASASTSS